MPSRGAYSTVALPLSNEQLAQRLDEVAALLEAQAANAFRVQAYRRAADTVRGLPQPAHSIVAEHGLAGLTALPGIGSSLARAIKELTRSGHLALLDRLRDGSAGEDAFATVPGLGAELAKRIHQELGIDSLYELEEAAHDGRLAHVPGLGRRRVQSVCETLAGRFRRRRAFVDTRRRDSASAPPAVAELLDVDREYRARARGRDLPRIAPRRFNPEAEAWLPILHTVRGSRHYTALFSNTARAHDLGSTHDWVVIYRDDDDGDGKWTVVTARHGALQGQRVVRGREAEMRELLANAAAEQAEAEPSQGDVP